MIFIRPVIIDTEAEMDEITCAEQNQWNAKYRTKRCGNMKLKKLLTSLTSRSQRSAYTIAKFAILSLLLLSYLTGCATSSLCMEPKICYAPPSCLLEQLKSPFAPLNTEELGTEWGKELYLGLNFAREEDYYRAITFYTNAPSF